MKYFIILLIYNVVVPVMVYAQGGDRAGEAMEDVVLMEEIPPAPVLEPREAYQTFEVAEGLVMDPVAWEPMLDKPVAMAWDLVGRLWVVEMVGYMMDLDGAGEDEANGRIRILEDTTGDGRMDSVKVFLDGLVLPRAIAFAYEGVLYTDGYKLLFSGVKDDKPHGEPVVVDPTYARGANVEHAANGLLLGLDGWYYSARSGNRYRRIGGEWVVEKTHQRGQWGITMDNFGRLYYNTNSVVAIGDRLPLSFLWSNPDYSPEGLDISSRIGGNRVFPIRMTPGVNRGYMKRERGYREDVLDEEGKLINATAISGIAYYRDDLFPERYRNALIVPEPGANLVKAVAVRRDGDRLSGGDVVAGRELIASTDERFRPVNAYMGPDGCIYVLDMYFGVLQHKTYLTTYLRRQYEARGLDQPSHGLGRLYRVRPKDTNPRAVPQMIGQSTPQLIALLEHRNGWVRDQAQRMLVQGERGDISAAVLRQYQNSRTAHAHIHALWTLQNRGELTVEFIKVGLQFPDEEVVATALQMIPDLEVEKRKELFALLPRVGGGDFAAPYLAKALASMGKVPAWDKLLELLEEAGDRPFMEAAVLAGIQGHEMDFRIYLDAQLGVESLSESFGKLLEVREVDEPEIVLEGVHGESYLRGTGYYTQLCSACHGDNGQGMNAIGPPLDDSEWVRGRPEVMAKIMLHGMSGPITVGGEAYDFPGEMPGLGQNPGIADQQLADIATYVRQAWSNDAPMVTAEMIAEVREATRDRRDTYSEEELRAELDP